MHHRTTNLTPASWTGSAGRERPVSMANGHIRRVSPAARRQGRLAGWSMAVIFLLFAYEWFISALDKVLSPDFRTGLAANLKDATKGNPNQWYVDWLNQTIIPHARTIATVVEVGEFLVALGFVLGAFLWWRGARLSIGWRRLLHVIVLVTLLASAFMTANYYVMTGKGVPWVNTADPFDEGLSIDGLLTLIALALFVLVLVAWPRRAPSERQAASEALAAR